MNSSIYSGSQSTDKQISSFKNLTSSDNFTEYFILIYLDENELYYNASNTTSQADDWRSNYKLILDIILLFALIIMLLAVGCDIAWENIFNHITRPIGLCIGMFSQFGIMPLSAYCILLISGIKGLHATGVLIISCCPSGGISNIFAYFWNGDLALSVTMTTTSTLVAMGMMPLNLWLYGRHFESDDLVIPYKKMAVSILIVTSPAIVGMFIKWKLPRIAAVTTKMGSYFSISLVFVCLGLEIAVFPNMITGIPLKLYVVVLTLPVIGLMLGYGCASLFKQSIPVRKTVSIGCSVRTVPIALTVIAQSLSLEMEEQIVLLPWLYLFAMVTSCSTLCLTNHFRKRYSRKTDEKTGADTTAKLDLLEGVKENVDPSF